MSWNFDISKAPRGRYVVSHRKFGKGEADVRVFEAQKVILATKCGKVTLSHYLPDEHRWMMLAKGEQPVAWASWPEHPISPSSQPSLATLPGTNPENAPAKGNLGKPPALKPPPGVGGDNSNEADLKSDMESPLWG